MIFKDKMLDAIAIDLGAIPHGASIPLELELPKKVHYTRVSSPVRPRVRVKG